MTPSKGQGFTPWGPHHFYTGGLVLLAGFVCIFHAPLWASLLLLSLGGFIMADDVVQHLHQGHDLNLYFGVWRSNPFYVSPVHRAYWHALNWLIDRTPEGTLRRLLEWAKTV